jgi:hypothetical protein
MVTLWHGVARRAHLSKSRNWCWADGVTAESAVIDARPLVVLDPESDEDVARALAAAKAFCRNWERKEVQKFIRALATPPKPAEPTETGALVRARARGADAPGCGLWARAEDGTWMSLGGDWTTHAPWSYLTDVEVIR